MEELINSFWQHYSAIRLAVVNEPPENVAKMDRYLADSIEMIINRTAMSAAELALQFQFATDLLQLEADDVGCVRRNIDVIRQLVERNLNSAGGEAEAKPFVFEPGSTPYVVLDEDLYHDDERATLALRQNYTVAYANPAFSTLFGKAIDEVLGRHSADILGIGLFRSELQKRIDGCFEGVLGRFAHSEEIDGNIWVKIYEFSPCYSPSKEFVGALITINRIADRRSRAS